MIKKEPAQHNSELPCPQCQTSFNILPDFPDFVPLLERHHFEPQPGDLTQCDHCQAMLEYWQDGSTLILRHARQQRVESFNNLSQSGRFEPTTEALVEYVRMYR